MKQYISKRIRTLFNVLLITLLMLVCGACLKTDQKTEVTVLQAWGQSSFNVTSDKVGTSASGKIVIYKKTQGLLGIRIISDISISETDFGGVAFYLPGGTVVDEIMSTYPEGEESQKNDEAIQIWTNDSDQEGYHSMIEIDRNHDYETAGGGKGFVVIDATYKYENSQQDAPDQLAFAVDCGASRKKSYVVWGIAHREIIVDLKTELNR